MVRLFNPRSDDWSEHFEFRGVFILGLSDVGSATVRLLNMNADDRIEIRQELLENGEM